MAQDPDLAALVSTLAARQGFLLSPTGDVLARAGPDPAPTSSLRQLAQQAGSQGRPILQNDGLALATPVAGGVLVLDSRAPLDVRAIDRARSFRLRRRLPRVSLLLLVGLLWLFGSLLLPRETPQAPPPPPSMTLLQTGQSYLSCLQTGRYAAAYDLLSGATRARLDRARFEERARAFMDDAQNRYDTSYLELRESDGGLDVKGPEGSYRWTAVREGEGWALDSLDGPLRIPAD